METPIIKWINVKNRLPDNREYILAHDGYGYTSIFIAFHHSGKFYKSSMSQSPLLVLFWMPLPERPTKEDSI